MSRKPQTQVLYTIGHSTRTLEEFIALLKAYGIQQIIDVRTIPRSRHNPQFADASLAAALPRAGIAYIHEPLLGGLRHTQKDSPNTGWKNKSFRGFADYMQTEDFSHGLNHLILLAKNILLQLCALKQCHGGAIGRSLQMPQKNAAYRSRTLSVKPALKLIATRHSYACAAENFYIPHRNGNFSAQRRTYQQKEHHAKLRVRKRYSAILPSSSFFTKL